MKERKAKEPAEEKKKADAELNKLREELEMERKKRLSPQSAASTAFGSTLTRSSFDLGSSAFAKSVKSQRPSSAGKLPRVNLLDAIEKALEEPTARKEFREA